MTIRVLSAITIIFITIAAQAQLQKSNQELYYGRYQGDIGIHTQACANLVRNAEQVYGNLYINDKSAGATDGKIGMSVVGSMNGDSITLSELGSNTALFTGILNPESMTGEYAATNQETIDFMLRSDYPEGSMPLDVSYLNTILELAPDTEESPVATLELTLLYPMANAFRASISDSVMKRVQLEFFGEGQQENTPDSMLLDYEREYYENYRKQNQQWAETGGHSFSWEKMINTGVVFNSENVLCLEFERYVFTGGAHGMSNLAYESINLLSGASFDYQTIFKPNSDSMLSELLTARLKNDRDINAADSLKASGYFVGKILPNHNLFITASGIGFAYNPYEIAPYSFGITRITLPWNQIIDLLETETPVYLLSQH